MNMLIIELLDDQIRRVWMNGSYCLFGRFFITFFSTYMRREVTVVLDFIKDDKEKIGDNLRKIRERKKLTQEKLAQIMDVDPQTVYRIESGKYSAETFLAAIYALKVDFEEVLPSRYKHLNEKKNKKDEVIYEIEQLPESKQKFVWDTASVAVDYIKAK